MTQALNIIKEFDIFLEQEVITNGIELCNEAGLQFQLGLFLKLKYPDIKIEFERNINSIGINKTKGVYHKSVVDILIDQKIAIEIKFPTKGAYPKRTYQAIQDVCFLEILKKEKNIEGYAIFITPLFLFFDNSKKSDGIYKYLRKEKRIYKVDKCDVKPFMSKGLKELDICDSYPFELRELTNNNIKYYYYIIKI
ncbi:hypothetical protein CLV91_0986 [Maribacter vaceletii]|uniref:Uncharacterized protein n=1 Tax=Maribacter vaceletii TaxID=1206816 RepID=A0A495EDE7_9FLAO|nr:hypothetical protein [Maribacter vaceletii]RKR14905.1 hypothetical protein CLV91_0986 [Maribacter vaceletii]